MSPRGSSAAGPSSTALRAAPAPYTRRPAGQPKSSRQQFSACGACRMRRVRCDLKDLPFTATGSHPACSNCKERGLKCVDEFADVKAVKLLRRGRRLQQVEVMYGKAVTSDGVSTSSPAARLPSIIPQLKVDFFSSPFWHWFCIQRPVLDPAEFSARFLAHAKGAHSLGNEGGLLAMVLAVWATSFGVDERGMPEADTGEVPDLASASTPDLSQSAASKTPRKLLSSDRKIKEASIERKRKEKKERTEAMLREVLELVDFHGVMRRPTWDGVRVLLLILPLMEDAHPLERLAMYEATLSQTQALCTLVSTPPETSSTFPGISDDTSLRTRIFWYAHIYEGITTGMRGGRLVLNADDFDTFQNTLPPTGYTAGVPGIPSPPSSHGTLNVLPTQLSAHKSQFGLPAQGFTEATQLLSLPLRLSIVCRKVHQVLTGPKATRRAEEHSLIDAHGMHEIWEDLDCSWHEFEAMRRNHSNERDYADIERFVSAWQVFIFECHNTIRESLKQCMSNAPSNDGSGHHLIAGESPSRPSSHSSNSSPYLSPHHLHTIATRKCHTLLPHVLLILKHHLSKDKHETDGPVLFEWDAGLIRDGCFFAGFLAASIEGDTIDFPAEEHDTNIHGGRRHCMTTEEGVVICLTALFEMKWAFSKSEEREESVRMIWENRKLGSHHRYNLSGPSNHHQDHGRLAPAIFPDHTLPATYGKSMSVNNGMPHDPHVYSSLPLDDRPLLPPLNLLRSPRRVESAPNTANTNDGHGTNGWPTYTPPGTATSVTTSAGTGMSARGSPIFSSLTRPMSSYKAEAHESFYPTSGDLDQFSFTAPMTGPGVNNATTVGHIGYHHRSNPPPAAPSMHGAAPIYLDAGPFGQPGSGIVPSSGDINGCPQFGDDCNGYYH